MKNVAGHFWTIYKRNFTSRPAKQIFFFAFASLVVFAAILIGQTSERHVRLRPFDACPGDEELFASNTFGYSLCIPKSWEGKYIVENRDHSINFMYVGNPNARLLLFGISVTPEPYWDNVPAARSLRHEIDRQGGSVYALNTPKSADMQGSTEEFAEFLGDVARVENSIAFSNFRSIDKVIEHYTDRVVPNPEGGTTFSAFEILGRDEIENGKGYKYYIWLYGREYYYKDGKVERGGIMSVPVSILVRRELSGYTVEGMEAPKKGEQFFPDLARIFPERIVTTDWFAEDHQYYNQHVAVLNQIVETRAYERFGKMLAPSAYQQ